MSFRLRYSLLGTGVVAAALVVFGWLVSTLVANTQAMDQDKALTARRAEAASAVLGLPPGSLTQNPLSASAGAQDLRKHTDIFIEILDPRGVVVSSTAVIDGAPPGIPVDLLAPARGGARQTTFQGPGVPPLRLSVEWVPTPGVYVVAGQPTRIQTQNLNGIKGFLIVSAIPTLLAAFAATWLVTGRLSRRFNSLITRLEESRAQLTATLDAQRRFVADASHELRTPLTTIRGNAGLLAFGPDVDETVRAAAARDIAGETERMSRLVEQLLTLARADGGQHLELAPLSLRPAVEEVVRQARTVHPDRRFNAELQEATVEGDQDALTQLLWILVDNGVKFTQADGCIALALGTADHSAVLTVTDDGSGIPPGDLDRIFERFYQADASRSAAGAGLGLSIARWIVAQHGGTITVRNNTPGPGCTFRVTLPLVGASLTASTVQLT